MSIYAAAPTKLSDRCLFSDHADTECEIDTDRGPSAAIGFHPNVCSIPLEQSMSEAATLVVDG